MADLSILRAAQLVGYRLVALCPEDDGTVRAELKLDFPVDAVLRAKVNGVLSDEVDLLGADSVLVALPPRMRSLAADELTFEVLVEGSVSTLSGGVTPGSYGIGLRPRQVEGLDEAVQYAVRSLMMKPGADVWSPARGGGLLSLRQKTLAASELADVASKVGVMVSRTNATLSTRKATGGWRVVRISVREIRYLTAAEATSRYGGTFPSGWAQPILAVTLVHHVQGPGETLDVASAVSLA